VSRKNKNYRAWLHQNPNGTPKEAWDAGWASQQGKAYSLRIQELETRIAEMDAEIAELKAEQHEDIELPEFEQIGKCVIEVKKVSRLEPPQIDKNSGKPA